MKPTADYVLIEPRGDRSDYVFLPPSIAGVDQAFRARVVAIGPHVTGVVVGDEVCVRRPEGVPTDYELLFVREESILARLEMPSYN